MSPLSCVSLACSPASVPQDIALPSPPLTPQHESLGCLPHSCPIPGLSVPHMHMACCFLHPSPSLTHSSTTHTACMHSILSHPAQPQSSPTHRGHICGSRWNCCLLSGLGSSWSSFALQRHRPDPSPCQPTSPPEHQGLAASPSKVKKQPQANRQGLSSPSLRTPKFLVSRGPGLWQPLPTCPSPGSVLVFVPSALLSISAMQ